MCQNTVQNLDQNSGEILTANLVIPTYPKVKVEFQSNEDFEEIVFATQIESDGETKIIKGAFRFVQEVDYNKTIALANTMNRFHEMVWDEINFPSSEDYD